MVTGCALTDRMTTVYLSHLLAATALQAPTFDFVHISDTHVEARATGASAPDVLRGEETFDWIAKTLASGAAQPGFVLATGDLTEFGAPGDTWRDVERLFAKLPMPWYPVMGNHDQTWNPIDRPYQALLDTRGVRIRAGRSYVQKREGWALVVLNSASLYEPRPSFDTKELEEIERVLGLHAWGLPVVVAMHHPPDSAEFAQPYSSRMLFSALDGLDVELILYGHGHRVRHSRVFGVDCVQGGSTFASKNVDERGYGRVTLKDGVLRSTYRSFDAANPERVLVDRTLHARAQSAVLVLTTAHPEGDRPGRLVATMTPPLEGSDEQAWRVLVDGRVLSDATWTSAPCENCDRRELPLAALALGDGLRLVTVEIDRGDGRVRQRSMTLDGTLVAAMRPLEPLQVSGHPVFVASPRFTHWFPVADHIDQRVEKVMADTLPGRPLRLADTVFFGDSDGRVHAIALGENWADDRFLWSTDPIGMAIESAPALVGDLLVVGAWDGNVHAYDVATGESKWSKPGPKSSEGSAARYYAPADCSPVVLQDRIYVSDRGYALAWYSLEGEMHRLPHTNVAAIGATADGAHLLLRGTDDVLTRIDRDGAVVWSTKVPLGRMPVPPLEKNGVVHVVSDQGLWSRVEAKSGAVIATIPTSATAHVFAPPEVGDDGSVVIRSQAGTTYRARPEPARPVSPAPTGPR